MQVLTVFVLEQALKSVLACRQILLQHFFLCGPHTLMSLLNCLLFIMLLRNLSDNISYFTFCSWINVIGRKKPVFRIPISFMRVRIQDPKNIHTYLDQDAMRIQIRIQGGKH